MIQVGVAAHSEPTPGLEDRARAFVRRLAEACGRRAAILLGGYWGVMKTVADEAAARGLPVVLLLPVEREDVEAPPGVLAVRTGCEFRCRSVALVRSSDVLVALGGAAGTVIEVLMAYAMGKPVLVLANSGMPSDRLRTAYPAHVDERRTSEIRYLDRPEELAEEACRVALSTSRHTPRFG